MTGPQTIVRLSATYHLTVAVGDRVCQGQKLREGPEEDGPSVAPTSGVVKSIYFDPGRHEFLVAIAPAD